MQKTFDAVIVGSGLTGLAAARRLSNKGVKTLLLERGEAPGGAITSREENGFLFEQGPSTLLRGSPLLEEIIAEAGLDSDLVPADTAARKRFIVRHGEMCTLPSSPIRFLWSPWLSPRGKLRLLSEPFRKKGPDELRRSESLADFTRRRLGPEVLDYGVNPFVSGIYAGDPERLLTRLAFPRLYAAESRSGSLLFGFLALAREARKKRGQSPRPPRGTISFRGGLATLPRRMAERLPTAPRYRHTVDQIRRSGDFWEVLCGNESLLSKTVLLTSWQPELMAACPAPPGDKWPSVEFSSVQIVNLGYRRDAISHPLDGFGVLVPGQEKLPFLGVIFASSIFPGRTPADQVQLNLFIGGARHPEGAHYDEETIRREILPAVHRLLGISGEPSFFARRSWIPAIPQYVAGHQDFLQTRQQWEQLYPGLFLAGTACEGISMPQSLEGGDQAAQRMEQFLQDESQS